MPFAERNASAFGPGKLCAFVREQAFLRVITKAIVIRIFFAAPKSRQLMHPRHPACHAGRYELTSFIPEMSGLIVME